MGKNVLNLDDTFQNSELQPLFQAKKNQIILTMDNIFFKKKQPISCSKSIVFTM